MSSVPAIPFTVLGGYLGAGKTTLLNRLLKDNNGTRIALLINDFGAINIDAELIESQSDQQINLTNGCVCCGLSDGFDEALSQLLASASPPQHIVVEASGVADVNSLAQYGKAPGLTLDAVIVVADAQNVRRKAQDKYVARTVQRQLQAASLLVLNKIDLINEQQRLELRQWLTEVTGGTTIVEASFCKLPTALVLGNGGMALTETDKPDDPHHEHYVTWQFESPAITTANAVSDFLAALPQDLLRGKGFFRLGTAPDESQCLEWHQVGQQQRITPAPAQRSTRLVAIGLRGQFDPAQLTELAQRQLNHSLGM